jgi:hypothetical protein
MRVCCDVQESSSFRFLQSLMRTILNNYSGDPRRVDMCGLLVEVSISLQTFSCVPRIRSVRPSRLSIRQDFVST